MPTTNPDLAVVADIVQEAITNLTNAAGLLAQKQPSRHTDRMVQAVHLETNQLSDALAPLRDLLRDPREPRAVPVLRQPHVVADAPQA